MPYVSREDLERLTSAAACYVEDLESGLADGTYDEGAETVAPIQNAIRRACAALESKIDIDTENGARLKIAQEHLTLARNLARAAGAPRTTARIRLALTSIGGAIRHAEGMSNRAPS